MSMFRSLLMGIGSSPTPPTPPTPTPRLPSEYQEVEYIESDGYEYIDTGYKHKTTTKYEFSFSVSSFVGQYNSICGARVRWNTTDAFDFGFRDDSVCYINVGVNNPATFYTLSLNTKCNIIMDKDYVTVNGNQISYLDCNGPNGETISNINLTRGRQNVHIFILNQNGNLIEPCACKLYSFNIYENNSLIMELVPCYRKADSVIGLYDMETQTFFTNSGSGTFTKGSDV